MILGVDIDQTIVDSHSLWIEWLSSQGIRTTIDEINNQKFDIDIEDFWRDENLYDSLSLYDERISFYLESLSSKYDIVFISKCFPEHIQSKYNFLKRNFKFKFSFMETTLKYLIDCDVMIDDSNSVLDSFSNSKTYCCKAKLPFVKQTIKYPVFSWDVIYSKLK